MVTSGYIWLHQVTYGYIRLHMVIVGYMWLRQVTYGYMCHKLINRIITDYKHGIIMYII